MVRPGPVQTHLRLTVGWAFKAAFLGGLAVPWAPFPSVRAPATEALASGCLLIAVYVCCCYVTPEP